jgi:Tol biopolymer transport system component
VHRLVALVSLFALGCPPAGTPTPPPGPGAPRAAAGTLHDDREVHLAEVEQLSRGARENAEAYWSFDGSRLIFQSNRPPYECDQIYSMPADGSGEPTLISTGRGRTTCSYFYPGDDRVLWSSTHGASDACPPAPDHSQGYVWAIYADYDIYVSKPDGTDVKALTSSPGYDAEATLCAVDGSIVFTSTRDGDLDLYRMDANGGNVVRLTDTPGYDGGAFFNSDCSQIVWRASRPTGDALADYQRLLAQGLVRPSKLELYVANADGTDARQITYLDAASFGPFFHPSGERILFSSNYGDARGREFDIWAVDVDGTRLERITYTAGFDGFPMFSPDGAKLAFGSNRNQKESGETDVYVAEWIDSPPAKVVERAPDRIMADVRWLADDAREGRGVGTAGLDASADWLVKRFTALGLAPRKQAFDVIVGVAKGDATALVVDGKRVASDAFVPSGGSATGSVKGAVAFAGYGITDASLGIDDYKRVKAKGKIVVVRRYAPKPAKDADEAVLRAVSGLHEKARNARDHGAIGMIVVDLPPGKSPPEESPLPGLRVDRHGDTGIPVMFVTRDVGRKLMRGRHNVAMTVELERERKPAHNIIGVLEAGGDKLPGVVLIGAHYDHLGLGSEGSLANPPAEGVPHNGADDNASGTAALLEVARALRAQRDTLRRDVWFVAFSGEESGLLGSTHFSRVPPDGLDIGNIEAMLNMDMVGRMRSNQLQVIGGASAKEWDEVVTPVCEAARVRCSLGGDGYGPSDQTPFYAAGSPVLHFFTGAHTDYHKPSDDADTINAAGAAAVAEVVAGVAAHVSARESALTYKSAPAPAPAGDVRSYGASLGTIPDYTGGDGGEPGVLLAGVRQDGPADKAGVKRGDRIVALGGKQVADIRDMMHVLRQAKPGETTAITVVRGGKRIELKVTYGTSRRRQ